MQRRSFLALGAAVAMPVLVTGCGTTMPISPVGRVGGLTQDEVRDCLYRAGRKRSWLVKNIDDNHLEATFVKGYHVAVINIEFDAQSYRLTVSPKTSSSLLNPDGSVHRKVNQWIANYDKDTTLLIQDVKMRKFHEN